MNFSRLRFVAERADVGEYREAIFAVTIPKERGSFKRFCELFDKRNVTEFNYRIGDQNEAHIFVGISTLIKQVIVMQLQNTFVKQSLQRLTSRMMS